MNSRAEVQPPNISSLDIDDVQWRGAFFTDRLRDAYPAVADDLCARFPIY